MNVLNYSHQMIPLMVESPAFNVVDCYGFAPPTVEQPESSTAALEHFGHRGSI